MKIKKYIEPSVTEGQEFLSLWEIVTSKPMTSREIEFARLVRDNTLRKLNCINQNLNIN